LDIDVYYSDPGRGWWPIEDLALLAARLFRTDIRPVRSERSSRLNLIRHQLLGSPGRRKRDRAALLIAPSLWNVEEFVREPDLLSQYSQIATYICDSMHVEKFNRPGVFRHFDLVARMRPHDENIYRKWVGERALYAPFGTDALDRGGWRGARDLDVLRVGRQPPTWEDDAASAAKAASAGLTFHGRPPMIEGHEDAVQSLLGFYRCSKFTVAHSNLVAAHGSTHATKEYITARWTDALACGTVVAGVQPTGDRGVAEELWPEGLIHLDDTDIEANLGEIAQANAAWTPEVARYNHLMSLKRLDWRWRLRAIANAMDWKVPDLDQDILRLEDRIAAVESAAA
jgi:hypothetical protein